RALMLCVSCALANEEEKVPDETVISVEKVDAVEEANVTNSDLWCFALSCDVVCGTEAVPDEMLEFVWYMLESGICH
ncbi:MAG: hypothetical protein QMB24_08550, partial [Spirosomataceae bacterium]